MTRKLDIDMGDMVASIPSRSKLNLSVVQHVPPSTLAVNPHNTTIFKQESEQYFERLREDVKKRGILVPLIARKKGAVLLAGHNRLKIAQELNLKFVPVQYVQDDLSEEQEQEFLIKDNLYRRQLSTAEWIEVYKKLYPNFDEIVDTERRGGNRKIKTQDGVLKNATPELTAKKIAEDVNLPVRTVQKHLQQHREERNSTATVVPVHKPLPITNKGGKPATKGDLERVDTIFANALKDLNVAFGSVGTAKRKEYAMKLHQFLAKREK